MDALSGILSLLNIDSVETSGLRAGGKWGMLSTAKYIGVKFVAVVSGSCLLRVNRAEAITIKEGDCFLLFGQPFWLGSDTSVEGKNAAKLYQYAENRIATLGSGDDVFLIGGRFTFSALHENLIIPALPMFVYVPGDVHEASVLRSTLDMLFEEISTVREGHALMLNHLAHILFVQVLRAYLRSKEEKTEGWLRGLTDPQIGSVLRAMHREPARKWTLPLLAKEAGMSRSNFIRRFKLLIGSPPLDYLIKWRMQLAVKELAEGKLNISEISSLLGYESESAFSAAFKRVMGSAPKFYKVGNTKRMAARA